jgi:hypothetical protein
MDNWKKSSFSADQGACVEVARHEDIVRVRDTKEADLGDGRTVFDLPDDTFDGVVSDLDTVTDMRSLLNALPSKQGDLVIELVDGWFTWKYKPVSEALRYTATEMLAFANGCRKGEFNR